MKKSILIPFLLSNIKEVTKVVNNFANDPIVREFLTPKTSVETPEPTKATQRPEPSSSIMVDDIEIIMDVRHNNDEVLIDIELPGVAKEDIFITCQNNRFTVEATVREESQSGKNFLIQERFFGRVQRTITIPGVIDEANIRASFTNGVLHVVLPKVNIRSRSIEIS